MAKFRKKVPLEAEKYQPGMEDGFGLLWPNGQISSVYKERERTQADYDSMFKEGPFNEEEPKPDVMPVIMTREGYMAISEGDWIATGVQGERYPIKDDIFNESYEPLIPAPVYRHKKRGATYRVLSQSASLQCASSPDIEETFADRTFTVYQSLENGDVYIRPTGEFHDGRFELVKEDE